MSTPSSTIYMCKGVRLNNNYLHTIYFDSKDAQSSYFSGKVAKTFSNYTFVRKSWSIKVGVSMETASTWSYLFFKNGSGKTYYYFITNLEYISDEMTEIFIELDVMQTYMFDYQLARCFVEREHSSSDEIGYNLVEESVELGDLTIIDETTVPLSDLCVLVLATYNPLNTGEENTDTVLSAKYDGVFSGLGVYAVNLSDWQSWGVKLKLLDDYGKTDGIVSMWMYPKNLVDLDGEATWNDGTVCKQVKAISPIFKETSRNERLAGYYKPKNNKLYAYPYNFLYVTNNNGTSAIYKYEMFGDASACNFKVVGALSPEGTTKMYPLNYNGVQHNYDEGIVLSGFPTCAWNQDVYKLWLAQNQNQQNLSLAMGGLSIVGGVGAMALTGGIGAVGGGGAVLHGASTIANILAMRKDKEVQPPQAKGNHSASVNVVAGFQTFTIQRKSITDEYARIIDDYFSMYGYQLNRVKIPNRNVRENWCYCKTVGCHVIGNICNEDLRKIESIYDAGITHWRHGDDIGNYGLTNNTI